MKRFALTVLVSSMLAFAGACGTSSSSDDEGSGTAASEVVLDVRCAADADCPSGFECEEEVEHGVDESYCVSHDEDAAANGECPAGYELEEEHGGTFCKPHDDDDDDDHSGTGGDDDDDDDDSGPGNDDDAEAEDGPDIDDTTEDEADGQG